jgi:hypothetical protein
MVLIGGAEKRAAIQCVFLKSFFVTSFPQPHVVFPLDSSPLFRSTSHHHQI